MAPTISVCAALAIVATLSTGPARADASASLLSAVTACTTPDVSFADRVAMLDAAGGQPLEGDARLQAARAMQVGWLLLRPVAAGKATVEDLPALFAPADDYAVREAAAEANPAANIGLAWRSLEGGAIAVEMFQKAPTSTTCALIAPGNALEILKPAYPPAEGIDRPVGPVGSLTGLVADQETPGSFIEVFQPDSSAIAAAWNGPVPGTFLLIPSVPTLATP